MARHVDNPIEVTASSFVAKVTSLPSPLMNEDTRRRWINEYDPAYYAWKEYKKNYVERHEAYIGRAIFTGIIPIERPHKQTFGRTLIRWHRSDEGSHMVLSEVLVAWNNQYLLHVRQSQ